MTSNEAEKAKNEAVEEHRRCETEIIVFARCIVDGRRGKHSDASMKFYLEQLERAVDAEIEACKAQLAAREAYIGALDRECAPALTLVRQ